MRKILLYVASISTIIIGLFNAPTTFAVDTEAEYLTLDDMETLSLETLEEVNSICDQSDRGCRLEYLMERRRRSDLYRSLDSYESRKFFITAVNPNNNTIRFIYNNKLRRNRILGQDEGEGASLIHLYIGRVEYDDHNRSPWHEMLSIVEGTEEFPEVHITFAWNTEDENRPDILPNIEYEFEMADDALLQGVRNVFYYEMKDTSPNGGRDVYRLTDCLANYQPGTECQIRFNNTGEVRYIPVNVEKDIVDEPNENSNEQDIVGEPDENSDNVTTDDASGATNENENNDENDEPHTSDVEDGDSITDNIKDTTADSSENIDTLDEPVDITDDKTVEDKDIELEPELTNQEDTGMADNIENNNSTEALDKETKNDKDESDGFGGEPETFLHEEPEQTDIKENETKKNPEKAQNANNIVKPKPNIILPIDKKSPEITPLTPNTGQAQTPEEKECRQSKNDSLSWVIGLSAASILFAAWWLIPVSKKKRQ